MEQSLAPVYLKVEYQLLKSSSRTNINLTRLQKLTKLLLFSKVHNMQDTNCHSTKTNTPEKPGWHLRMTIKPVSR